MSEVQTGLTDEQVVARAAECLQQGRDLIVALDSAPSYIRKTEQAKQARQTAVTAIELVAELIRRVRAGRRGSDDGQK